MPSRSKLSSPQSSNQYLNQYLYQPSQSVSPRSSYIPHNASNSTPNPDSAPATRKPSRVHFDEPSDAESPGNGMNPPILAVSSSPTQPLRPRSREDGGHQSGPPIWNIPNYTGNDNDDGASRRPSATHVQLPSTVPPHQPPVAKAHRDSDATLYDLNHNSDSHMPEKTDSKKYSVSSTSDNPYAPLPHSSSAKRGRQSISVAPDISSLPFHSTPLRSVNFPPQEGDGDDGMPAAVEETDVNPEHEKKFTSEQRRERRGILAHLHNYDGTMRFPEDELL